MRRSRRGIKIPQKFTTVRYWRVYAPSGPKVRGYHLGIVKGPTRIQALEAARKLAFELNVYEKLSLVPTKTEGDVLGG